MGAQKGSADAEGTVTGLGHPTAGSEVTAESDLAAGGLALFRTRGGQEKVDCTNCLTSWVPLKWRPVAPLCRAGIQATGMANPLREQPDTKIEARRQQGPQPGRNQGARWGMQKEQTSADRLERLVGTGGPTLPGQLAPPLYRLPGRSARARKAGACTGLAGQPIRGRGRGRRAPTER